MDERAFEGLMSRAASAMPYPATPDVRASVLARIEASARPAPSARPQPQEQRQWRWPALPRPMLAAATGAAALVLAFGAALAVPSSREAIAEFFGIEGSKIERLPSPPAGATATPFPPATALPAGAQSASIDEIASALGFEPGTPRDAGEPDSSYLVRYSDEPVAILRYPEFDLWQMQARQPEILINKGVPEGAVVLELTVQGRPAYFVEGGPHIVRVFDDASGAEIPGSERTVERNTLIFATDQAFYRIETDLPRLEALRIAETLP